jgi:hypothetical protein
VDEPEDEPDEVDAPLEDEPPLDEEEFAADEELAAAPSAPPRPDDVDADDVPPLEAVEPLLVPPVAPSQPVSPALPQFTVANALPRTRAHQLTRVIALIFVDMNPSVLMDVRGEYVVELREQARACQVSDARVGKAIRWPYLLVA